MTKYPAYKLVPLDVPVVRRKSAIWACVIAICFGVLIGLGWGLVQHRVNGEPYCLQWDQSTHDFVRREK